MAKTSISVTHHRSGRIDVCRDGQHIACLSDETTIGETLRKLGVGPDDLLAVQTKDGRDWTVAARSYLEQESA